MKYVSRKMIELTNSSSIQHIRKNEIKFDKLNNEQLFFLRCMLYSIEDSTVYNSKCCKYALYLESPYCDFLRSLKMFNNENKKLFENLEKESRDYYCNELIPKEDYSVECFHNAYIDIRNKVYSIIEDCLEIIDDNIVEDLRQSYPHTINLLF